MTVAQVEHDKPFLSYGKLTFVGCFLLGKLIGHAVAQTQASHVWVHDVRQTVWSWPLDLGVTTGTWLVSYLVIIAILGRDKLKASPFVERKTEVQSQVARPVENSYSYQQSHYNADISQKLAQHLNLIAHVVIVGFVLLGALMGFVAGNIFARDERWIYSLIFGGLGWLFGYLTVILVRVIAQTLLVLTQIEINGRPTNLPSELQRRSNMQATTGLQEPQESPAQQLVVD